MTRERVLQMGPRGVGDLKMPEPCTHLDQIKVSIRLRRAVRSVSKRAMPWYISGSVCRADM